MWYKNFRPKVCKMQRKALSALHCLCYVIPLAVDNYCE